MQFDLFHERRGPAEIVAFPLVRRRHLVAQTARALADRTYDDGRRFWNKHVREIRRDMKASGLSSVSIAGEIEHYRQAVAYQTIILTSYLRSQPDDAA